MWDNGNCVSSPRFSAQSCGLGDVGPAAGGFPKHGPGLAGAGGAWPDHSDGL